ncbi:unnamed protein product [Lecanosticta acicola]|uniref:Unnamed protein product n=1 Tax=Lecanosticta acicola TaxID=111012 RepID=A0AAI8YX83_9PEZI|nr:unnamed protein product [Lecanosticta acicola]
MASLLSLPPEIQRQIFGYLLVPGCIEFGKANQKCNAIITYTIWDQMEPAEGPQRWRLLDFSSRYAWYRRLSALLTKFGANSQYLQWQLQRRVRAGTGPHTPIIYDLRGVPFRSRAISIARDQATCPCGHCEQREAYGLTNTWPRESYIQGGWRRAVRIDDFLAPLLVCRQLYRAHRSMIFSENIFSFQDPCDLAEFLLRLRPW